MQLSHKTALNFLKWNVLLLLSVDECKDFLKCFLTFSPHALPPSILRPPIFSTPPQTHPLSFIRPRM